MSAAAEVTYVKVNTEVVLDYDTKNQKFSDEAVVTDAKSLTYTLNIINTVFADDLRWPYYSALLNGAPMNTHALLWDGILNPRYEDVTITVS
ncbi:uncharacterized protein METZ01_LOCUS399688 [marine metagenome]|uniref:Uncharacterized protein n=1 Tax=marine metagenome TaxID=408172 RepID=A0A382VK52_9ZZZZ